MSIKVFQTNKAGKIEFTRCELEKLLNETYKEGHADGEAHAKKDYWTWTSPILTGIPLVTYGGTSAIRTTPDSPTITCTNAKVDTDTIAKLAVPSEEADAHKIITNVSANDAKGQIHDLSDWVKEIDQILFGETPAIYRTHTTPKNEHNANLAKELRNV